MPSFFCLLIDRPWALEYFIHLAKNKKSIRKLQIRLFSHSYLRRRSHRLPQQGPRGRWWASSWFPSLAYYTLIIVIAQTLRKTLFICQTIVPCIFCRPAFGATLRDCIVGGGKEEEGRDGRRRKRGAFLFASHTERRGDFWKWRFGDTKAISALFFLANCWFKIYVGSRGLCLRLGKATLKSPPSFQRTPWKASFFMQC